MLRMRYWYVCGAEDDVDDLTNLDSCCPRCHSHHGEVRYFSSMNSEEFLKELSNMTDKDIAKYANAIQLCATDIIENNL